MKEIRLHLNQWKKEIGMKCGSPLQQKHIISLILRDETHFSVHEQCKRREHVKNLIRRLVDGGQNHFVILGGKVPELLHQDIGGTRVQTGSWFLNYKISKKYKKVSEKQQQ